jgi:very-short-patch-repair endonuclease
MTEAERKLWFALRQSVVLQDTHFRRQVPLGAYIADFCCLGARLIVEVDGGQHFTDRAEAYDAARTRYLNDQGFKVLRFANRIVLRATETVLETIYAALQMTQTGMHPLPAAACMET